MLPVIATAGAPRQSQRPVRVEIKTQVSKSRGPPTAWLLPIATIGISARPAGSSRMRLHQRSLRPKGARAGRGRGTIVGEAKERPAFFAPREWDAGLFAFARRDRIFTRGLRHHHQIEW
jgi:hypothetical protein